MKNYLVTWDKICKGITKQKKIFCGPHTVQIDLTDKCNSSCVACWIHSPLVEEKKSFPEGKKQLSFELVKSLINDLSDLGTQEVILSGSGEPFLYPEIKEVIKNIKSKNMYLNIITNASLIDEEMAELLVKCKVDLITASIWAGDAETYSLTHPGKSEADFEKIKSNLKKLAFYKKRYGSLEPHLKLYNVICSKNYRNIEEMVDFAKSMDADSLEFQVVDIISGKTDHLALKDAYKSEIVNQLDNIRKRKDLISFNTPKEMPIDSFIDEEFFDFGKIWKNYKNGFCVSQCSSSLVCKKDHEIKDKRIIVSESTSTRGTRPVAFWYKFENNICKTCEENIECVDDENAVSIKLLNMLGIGSFLRRLLRSDLERGIYEKQINSIPCYIGWYYSRILANGDVIPCCKAGKLSLGNIKKRTFSKIWHSYRYKKFRLNAKNLTKHHKYFSNINCIKSCDNWGVNLEIDGRLKEFENKEKKKEPYLLTIKNSIIKGRVEDTLAKITRNIKPNNLKKRYSEILGVFDGEHGYKGPFHVQIDLTNDCNNTCIACWCNSPLLKEKRLSADKKNQYLPLGMVKELLDEITNMGATEVYYSGSGEPFMHPAIMEILDYSKKKGLICHVNTNFTLLNQEKIDCLIDMEVDHLTVSVWAATAETYAKTHPNKTEADFQRIKENLLYLNLRKKSKPCIKIYNVIFNMNYLEVEKMLDFAVETKSESLEFTLVDTMPGATDMLALNQGQLDELNDLCRKIKLKLDKNYIIRSKKVLLFQFEQFLRRISVSQDVQEAKYDRGVIDSMPCYIGWLFARIIPNGEVHSCLKAHRIPTGSLYKDRFFEIWNSAKQAHFRKKTLVCRKDDPFFRLIGNDPNTKEAGCYKSCDDIGRNTWMHNKMNMLTPLGRLTLKYVAKAMKPLRRLRSKNDNFKNYHSDPLIAGVIHGRKAFLGPEQVVIDPTNKCNLQCISCWMYSPLLKKNKPALDLLKQELSKEVLIKLIDDLADLGTKRIRFTGGGEPFMHKDLMTVIEHARKKNILVAVTTNFGLVSRQDILRLCDLGLEELCISIWGSSSRVYNLVHPGTGEDYFKKLKENLSYLKGLNKYKPRTTFANVIMNNNFTDFEAMYDFALDHGADAAYFTLVDIISGQTDKFLLNKDERSELLKRALMVQQRNKDNKLQLEFFENFLKRVSSFQGDFEKGEYDKSSIDQLPCYAGWIFSRVLADGSVAPCCRGVKKIIGNIKTKSFKDIWFSPEYNEFRVKAKYLSKSNAYFKDIGCIKECDNLMHNQEFHKRINLKEGG
ncbi:MAG: radical SAM protein [Candidatus Omnitrophica bacterium]|nr:radical SAM protein [Candidatus Omnitrophota bacterium]